jgi:hypothetical protein
MIFDLFIHRLTCAHCGTEYPRVLVSTCIEDEPGAHDFYVGDHLEIIREDLLFNDLYFTLAPFDPQGELRLLEDWECTTCRTSRWAEIVIGADNTFKSIEAVRLDPGALDRANLISTGYLRLEFESWTGYKLWIDATCTKPRPDWLELLRKHVAETPE